ncbi:glycosyltransferase, partial [Streptomyces sp. P17]|uniref:glycosyltransferase n=1 Tax=Streptomyces sp. P17 TaxID=3074716 RepID=UPI0028F43755
TEEKLKDYIPSVKIDNLDKIIKCHGLVSAESAANLVKNSDFSIIIRPDIRSVQAGFPTKFVESLSVGTPVIANLTSDLGVYLKHGINGYICKDDSIGSLVDVLISSINNNDLYAMRTNARETAEKYFDVSVYSAHMKRIIES